MGANRKAAKRGKKSNQIVIPDKLYFRIGEVARLCHLPAYVLRFWETEFPLLRPVKGSTGQRMYRRRDVENVLRIRQLLYEEGFTIEGARRHLRSDGQEDKKQQNPLPFPAAGASNLMQIRHGLEEILGILSARR